MGEMRIMNQTGDIVIRWEVTDGESTERAKSEWDRLKADGYEFFLAAEGDNAPKRVKRWDPDRGEVIAAPGVKAPEERKTSQRSGAMSGGPNAAERGDELTR